MISHRRGAARRALVAIAGLGLVASALPVAATTLDSSGTATTSYADGQYIVVLKGAPLSVHPATKGHGADKVDTTSSTAKAYRSTLTKAQEAVLADVSAKPTYRYTTALNGFAVHLSGTEANRLAARSDVESVTLSTVRQLTVEDDLQLVTDATAEPDTDISPDLLGLRGAGGVWEQLGGSDKAGAGTIVGIIDTGLEYTNPSFDPAEMPAEPEDWNGTCDSGEDATDWPAEACNDKNIGGRYFVDALQASGAVVNPADSVSPRDTNGHGTHTSGTAAGRDIYIGDGLYISGMAPVAHIATYKVCWTAVNPNASGCYDGDSIAAIDAAVVDGVDVLNFSISGDPETFEDPVDLAFKNAAASGVYVAASAGNYADEGVPVAHIGPWMTTAGAAVHREGSEDGPVPSIIEWSGRGPVAVDADSQTILKPDVGAPGVDVLAAYIDDSDGPRWVYLSGTSMSSPHIAGLGLLLHQAHPAWSSMAIKSAIQTSARDYANAESNDPFVGGTGFVEPRNFLEPGLIFDSSEADWNAFLADQTTGSELNAAYLQIPSLTASGPTEVTRTVTNPGASEQTYTASYDGPGTLAVTIEPETVTIPAGGTAELTISVANTGAPVAEWQKGWITWSNETSPAIRIPVIARGEVSEETPMVERVYGPDRYGTAAEVSELFPDGAETVYVTSGQGFADAMAGGPPASRGLVPGIMETPEGDPAPVLLVRQNRVPAITHEAIEDVNPDNIVILGGEATVSGQVEDEIRANHESSTVTRVGGADRYETAANLAMMFPTDLPVVYLASGENPAYPDALTGGALAGKYDAPVLLTKKGTLPDATAEALEELNPEQIVVLGGTAAVSDAVYDAAGASDRLFGSDRYGTAVAVSADYATDVPVVYIASGQDYPDALSGSALAGFEDVPVLITRQDRLPQVILDELDRLSPERVVILGGTAAVSQAVEDKLNESYPGWVG